MDPLAEFRERKIGQFSQLKIILRKIQSREVMTELTELTSRDSRRTN
jgi:hypothetical protein